MSVDGFSGELGYDREGGFVSLEEVGKRSGMNRETGDSSGRSKRSDIT